MCQCPRRALLISTDLGITFGFRWIIVCQCPRRALLISTPIDLTLFTDGTAVSMPSAGSSHFYWGAEPQKADLEGCVNALGGLFSFLHSTFSPCTQKEGCVNALGGLFSFLQPAEHHRRNATGKCVNALGGLFSFLR